MQKRQAITFSYAPVSNAKGGKGNGGSGAGVGGSSAARMVSYLTGADLRDPAHRQRIRTERSDVLEVDMLNWPKSRLRPTREDLQSLINMVHRQDQRSNSRQGGRFYATLPSDPREHTNPELARRMERARRHVAKRLVQEAARQTGGAWVYAIHDAPTRANPLQKHLHAFGTRRQVERDGQGNVVGLDNRDVEAWSSPGRVTRFCLHMREYHAKELNAWTTYAWGKHARIRRVYEHRSFARQAEEVNARREAEGLMPLAAQIASRKEGPLATRFRRLEAAGEDTSQIQLGERTRAAMEHNNKVRALNAEIERRNQEITRYDEVMRDRVLPMLRSREEAQQMEAERQARGKVNPAEYVWKREERERYEALVQRGGDDLGLQRELNRLPKSLRDWIHSRFPRATARVRSILNATAKELAPEQGRDRGGWSRVSPPDPEGPRSRRRV